MHFDRVRSNYWQQINHLLEAMKMGAENSDGRDELARNGDAMSSGRLPSLPVIADAATGVRRFYEAVAPQETDSTRVRVAKEVFRCSSAVAGAAFVAMLVL